MHDSAGSKPYLVIFHACKTGNDFSYNNFDSFVLKSAQHFIHYYWYLHQCMHPIKINCDIILMALSLFTGIMNHGTYHHLHIL